MKAFESYLIYLFLMTLSRISEMCRIDSEACTCTDPYSTLQQMNCFENKPYLSELDLGKLNLTKNKKTKL